MDNIQKDYPLIVIDREGKEIKIGDKVAVLSMPEWLVNDLDNAATTEIKSREGPVMIAYEIDEDGYVWLETMTTPTKSHYESRHFGMEPNNLLILK